MDNGKLLWVGTVSSLETGTLECKVVYDAGRVSCYACMWDTLSQALQWRVLARESALSDEILRRAMEELAR